jgi:hypothetical protein
MSGPGGTLCLDLSGNVGWAYGSGPVPERFGLWTLRGNRGLRLYAFRTALWDHLDEWRPARVCMESPLALPAQTSAAAARQQYGLAAYVEGECAEAGVPVIERTADEVRRRIIGRTRSIRAPTGTAVDLFGRGPVVGIKDIVVEHVRSLGLPVADDNIADAIVLYLGLMAEQRHARRAA